MRKRVQAGKQKGHAELNMKTRKQEAKCKAKRQKQQNDRQKRSL